MLLDVCGFFDKNKKIQQTPDFIFFTLFILVQSLQSLSSCFKDVCLIFTLNTSFADFEKK
jgi:hypothetical protein